MQETLPEAGTQAKATGNEELNKQDQQMRTNWADLFMAQMDASKSSHTYVYMYISKKNIMYFSNYQ